MEFLIVYLGGLVGSLLALAIIGENLYYCSKNLKFFVIKVLLVLVGGLLTAYVLSQLQTRIPAELTVFPISYLVSLSLIMSLALKESENNVL